MPELTPNGDCGWVWDDRPRLWMEIDVSYMNSEGDLDDEALEAATQANSVDLHIPYAFFQGASFESAYLPLAKRISTHLGWELFDPQVDDENT